MPGVRVRPLGYGRGMWCHRQHTRRRRAAVVTLRDSELWPAKTPLCASCARAVRAKREPVAPEVLAAALERFRRVG